MGNGGSALAASHIGCDLGKGPTHTGFKNRFKVTALTDSISTITAWANDSSYEDVFVEQLRGNIEKGDVIIGISGSGNSENVIKAVEFANENGATTIGLTGFDGGKLGKAVKVSLNVPVDDMQIAEDLHIVIVHLICKYIAENQD